MNTTKSIREKLEEREQNILSEYEEQLDPRVFEIASQEISNTVPEENKNKSSENSFEGL